MDKKCFDEIISILNILERGDLAEELLPFEKKIVDEDYKPTTIEIKQSQKKEKYSDSEGSAEEESLTYSVDQSGFYQLEFSDDEET